MDPPPPSYDQTCGDDFAKGKAEGMQQARTVQPVPIMKPDAAAPAMLLDDHGRLLSAGTRQLPGTLCWECFFPSRTGIVEFFDAKGDTVFILEPRPMEMVVAMNACIGGQFGEQENTYIPLNSSSFRAFVTVTEIGFSVVFEDGVEHKLFRHRTPASSFSGFVKYTPGAPAPIHKPNNESFCCVIL
jgi:hypothetical protein